MRRTRRTRTKQLAPTPSRRPRVAGPFPRGVRSRDTEREFLLLRDLCAGVWTVGSLADKYGVTVGTIRRDVLIMRAIGVPIERDPGAYRGDSPTYRVSPDAMLRVIVEARPKPPSYWARLNPRNRSQATGLLRALILLRELAVSFSAQKDLGRSVGANRMTVDRDVAVLQRIGIAIERTPQHGQHPGLVATKRAVLRSWFSLPSGAFRARFGKEELKLPRTLKPARPRLLRARETTEQRANRLRAAATAKGSAIENLLKVVAWLTRGRPIGELDGALAHLRLSAGVTLKRYRRILESAGIPFSAEGAKTSARQVRESLLGFLGGTPPPPQRPTQTATQLRRILLLLGALARGGHSRTDLGKTLRASHLGRDLAMIRRLGIEPYETPDGDRSTILAIDPREVMALLGLKD